MIREKLQDIYWIMIGKKKLLTVTYPLRSKETNIRPSRDSALLQFVSLLIQALKSSLTKAIQTEAILRHE